MIPHSLNRTKIENQPKMTKITWKEIWSRWNNNRIKIKSTSIGRSVETVHGLITRNSFRAYLNNADALYPNTSRSFRSIPFKIITLDHVFRPQNKFIIIIIVSHPSRSQTNFMLKKKKNKNHKHAIEIDLETSTRIQNIWSLKSLHEPLSLK